MKKFIFTIAAAVLVFTNVNAGNKVNTTEVKGGAKVHDTAIVHPVSVTGDENAIVAVIAQDAKITEATLEPAAPLLPGKSQEEIIAGDNLVIEGTATKEIFPLDLKRINGEQKKNKKAPLKNTTGERLMGCL